MLWRLWLLVWSEGPSKQGTMSPIELLWTANKQGTMSPIELLWTAKNNTQKGETRVYSPSSIYIWLPKYSLNRWLSHKVHQWATIPRFLPSTNLIFALYVLQSVRADSPAPRWGPGHLEKWFDVWNWLPRLLFQILRKRIAGIPTGIKAKIKYRAPDFSA